MKAAGLCCFLWPQPLPLACVPQYKALKWRDEAGRRVFGWYARGKRAACDIARGLHYLVRGLAACSPLSLSLQLVTISCVWPSVNCVAYCVHQSFECRAVHDKGSQLIRLSRFCRSTYPPDVCVHLLTLGLQHSHKTVHLDVKSSNGEQGTGTRW